MKTTKRFLASLLVFSLAGCGGGGGSNVARPASGAVSGAVLVPAALVSLQERSTPLARLAGLFLRSAHAALTGLVPAPDGTPVELVRVDANGNAQEIIASTTVRNAAYSFDLGERGYASDLLVRARVGSAELRAFASDANADVSPASEAGVQLLLAQIAQSGGALSALTLQEIEDAVAGIDQLTDLQALGAGADVQAGVETVKTAVDANQRLSEFVRSAAAPGQTQEGVGDIGEYLPTLTGTIWDYRLTRNGVSAGTSSTRIAGTRAIGGVPQLVFASRGSNFAEVEDYYTKSETEFVRQGTNNPLGNQGANDLLLPSVEYRFPLRAGASFTQAVPASSAIDFDADGRADNARGGSVVTTVEKFEEIAVPFGALPNCARVKTTNNFDVDSTRVQRRLRFEIVETAWLCSKVGLARLNVTLRVEGERGSDTLLQELTGMAMP
jgi:hypothetical protein